MNIAIADIQKIMGINKSNLSKFMGLDIAAGGVGRGIFGGYTTYMINVIDYITINSAGNASDFGNLTTAKSGLSATSDD
jgi:hypothetical protein